MEMLKYHEDFLPVSWRYIDFVVGYREDRFTIFSWPLMNISDCLLTRELMVLASTF